MAMKNDGNTRNSLHHKPYDPNNSFVKKLSKFLGLDSMSSNNSRHTDGVSVSENDKSDFPLAKRIRVDTNLPITNSMNENNAYSPIQPTGNSEIDSFIGVTNKTSIAASTPAIQQANDRSKPNQTNFHSNIKSNSSRVTNSGHLLNRLPLLSNEPKNKLPVLTPQKNANLGHNVTLPTSFSEVNNSPERNRTFGFDNLNSPRTRGPSFNIDVFTNSRSILGLSACDKSKNLNSYSPFYSARTTFGGASALISYRNENVGRGRPSSSSKMDLFSPRTAVSMQPVSKKKSDNVTNGHEFMSAAARQILETIEKCSSPIADAKRIPSNDSFDKTIDVSSNVSLRGMKRKLPSIMEITPNTSDLLRLKRDEQTQKSVTNARQVASSNRTALVVSSVDDSDSNDSTDGGYRILNQKDNDNGTSSVTQKYINKIMKKHEKKNEELTTTPVSKVNLPSSASLKITNLPTFDIRDMFTFSKPALIDLEQDDTNADEGSQQAAAPTPKKSTTLNERSMTESSPISECASSNFTLKKPPTLPPSAILPTVPKSRTNSTNDTKSSNTDTTLMFKSFASPKQPSKKKIEPWTCKVCALSSTDDKCNSCFNSKVTNDKMTSSINLTTEKESIPSTGTPTVTKASSSISNTFLPPPSVSANDISKSVPKREVGSSSNEECRSNNDSKAKSCASYTTPKPGTPVAETNTSTSSLSSTTFPNFNTSSSNTVKFGNVSAVDTTTSSTLPVANEISAKVTHSAVENDVWKKLSQKPPGTWNCSECFVPNESTENACVSCGSAKVGCEGPKSSTISGSNEFKPTPLPKPSGIFSFGFNVSDNKAAGVLPLGHTASNATSEKPSVVTFTPPKSTKLPESTSAIFDTSKPSNTLGSGIINTPFSSTVNTTCTASTPSTSLFGGGQGNITSTPKSDTDGTVKSTPVISVEEGIKSSNPSNIFKVPPPPFISTTNPEITLNLFKKPANVNSVVSEKKEDEKKSPSKNNNLFQQPLPSSLQNGPAMAQSPFTTPATSNGPLHTSNAIFSGDKSFIFTTSTDFSKVNNVVEKTSGGSLFQQDSNKQMGTGLQPFAFLSATKPEEKKPSMFSSVGGHNFPVTGNSNLNLTGSGAAPAQPVTNLFGSFTSPFAQAKNPVDVKVTTTSPPSISSWNTRPDTTIPVGDKIAPMNSFDHKKNSVAMVTTTSSQPPISLWNTTPDTTIAIGGDKIPSMNGPTSRDGATTPQFIFNTQNNVATPMGSGMTNNSLFASSTPADKTVPAFANAPSLFQPLGTDKINNNSSNLWTPQATFSKSGGFSFPNSTPTTENENIFMIGAKTNNATQNTNIFSNAIANQSAATNSTTFNLTVPSNFNFNQGNKLVSFNATSSNNSTPPRKFKKATRRVQK